MSKTGIPFLNTALYKLFNLILHSGFFPKSWREGIITPIYISGNKHDPANYRGICINSCLGKLFTSVLNTRLQNHLLDQNILHQAQIGFLPDHRTSDHIFTLRTLVDKYVNQVPKGKLYTCFVDFKKAFDSVWHAGLFYKLLQYNIGGKFYDLIKNLYSKTKCSIKISNQRTEFFDYCNVRQGNCTCFELQEKHKLFRNAQPVNLLFQLQLRGEHSKAINFFSLLGLLCCFAVYKARLFVIEGSNLLVKSKHCCVFDRFLHVRLNMCLHYYRQQFLFPLRIVSLKSLLISCAQFFATLI